jgi:hypothetical protein
MHIMAAVLFRDGVERQYHVATYPGEDAAQAPLPALVETYRASMNAEDMRYVVIGATLILLAEVIVINFSLST